MTVLFSGCKMDEYGVSLEELRALMEYRLVSRPPPPGNVRF